MRFGQAESPNACLLCHTEKTAEWVQVKLQTWKSTTRSNAQRLSSSRGHCRQLWFYFPRQITELIARQLGA
jgi:hypothetical protein